MKKIVGLLIVICMTGVIAFAEELKPIELSAPQMDRGKLLMQALRETHCSNSEELAGNRCLCGYAERIVSIQS